MRFVSRGLLALVALVSFSASAPAAAQSVSQALSAIPLREVGPAAVGGRIADIAVNPLDKSTWYVAVGSGGLWKTTNAGTTWAPVFDEQKSFSIGTVALDPSNPDVVWVGTGENVSGRHVGWGSGIYVSRDAGKTWEHKGLERSEHIGKILMHRDYPGSLIVAAEGPLWSAGGQRGLFRTSDGGDTWEQILEIDEHTGVTDVEIDPSDPKTLYAAAFQRRRHVWGYMGGGSGSGIYKSTDGGDSWREITTGLPSGDIGKIGIAVTPANAELVYATIEAADGQQGFYRSTDKGESWERRNGYISGGTGPHYYQEIEASPTEEDIVIQMDVFYQITTDGGASFDNLGTGREKHSDNHALWIDPDNTLHMLSGTDAGLYETFDRGTTWRHFPNMPISQFYKVAVSNREPFYDILGGAQDLGTLWGPARTLNTEGVRNSDWLIPMGADGYGVQIDPSDPDIMYLMTQQGNLFRTDAKSWESLQIQPQPAPGDAPERWNWDSPILISPHDSDRLYFASQRLWRSEDRGDNWNAISEDLTTNTNRYELPYMGRVWELDALHDNGAMSKYSTVTSITESSVQEGLLYTGSDDGLIHFTSDAGQTWTRAGVFPGVPERAFINDVEASQHDANTVFAAADAHKIGNYTPYLFRSDDNGQNWTNITGDLPDETIVWAVQQDHVDPNLLVIAAEWGIYFSPNGGTNWHKLAGSPTIAFRDVKLHRRDNDIIGATFGRGFYILDDYSPLREIASGALDGLGGVAPVRDAWWYVPHPTNQAVGRPTLGSSAYAAPNPDFGALLTYLVPEMPETAQDAREGREAEVREQGGDAQFPGYEALFDELTESGPQALIRIDDVSGTPIRWIEGSPRAGLHRVAWDLRRAAPNPMNLSTPGFRPPWVSDPQGPLAPPGEYSAQLVVVSSAGAEEIGQAQSFEVKPVASAPGVDFIAVAEFQYDVSELQRRVGVAGAEMGRQRDRLPFMRAALLRTPRADPALFNEMDAVERAFNEISVRLQGDRVRGSLNESTSPAISSRVGNVVGGHWSTRQNPTGTQRRNIEIAQQGLGAVEADLAGLIGGRLMQLEEALAAAGAPWTPGRRIGGRP